MLDLFYKTMLAGWQTLFNYARRGRLADASPMPQALQTLILAHYPVVLALCTRGIATSATEVAVHRELLRKLGAEYTTLERLANRFGLYSVISMSLTPVWRQLPQFWTVLREVFPELAATITQSVPDMPSAPSGFGLGLGLGTAATVALGIGGLLLFIKLKG